MKFIILGLLVGCSAMAQEATEATKHTASGTFEVKLVPQKDEGGDPGLGRMTIDKTFAGDLTGTSLGQMLSMMGTIKGSAGYVAIERVTGKIGERLGSFALQHNATMNRGVPMLNIIVIPDSGTDGFTGISGTLDIKIEDGKHFYTFVYTLPE